MIHRRLTEKIKADLKRNPVVVITGPRQVGKTTLVRKQLGLDPDEFIYLDMERTSDENKIIDPEIYFSQHRNKLIIIDEVQRRPELFPLIRSEVDEDRKPARFLLLGSASDKLLLQAGESLAGRVSYMELQSIDLTEIQEKELQKLWLQGGFPLSFLATVEESFLWRSNFVRSYLVRELAFSRLKTDGIAFERFVRIVASVNGQVMNYQSISRATGLTNPTVKNYLDFLEQSFLIRTLHPWFTNNKKRLVKSPKVYFRDSGLLHSLLSIESQEDLESNIAKGASWEGFVIQQIISLLKESFGFYFYRTSNGAEVDLVISKSNKIVATFEIKYSNSPSPTRSMTEALNDLACNDNFMVTPSSDEYKMKDNLMIIPVSRLPYHMTRLGIAMEGVDLVI